MIYTHKLTLYEALTAKSILVRTLDNRTIIVPIDEVIEPKKIVTVPGEGMVEIDDNEFSVEEKVLKKGNLVLKFDIVFPKQLEENDKEELREIF